MTPHLNRRTPQPVLIQGNFTPKRSSRGIAVLTRLSFLALGILMISALVLYGINVYYASSINELGQETREMNESNKELQVELNRTRAFQNVEVSAARLSHLHPPEEMIEVVNPALTTPKETAVRTGVPPKQEPPPIYGY